MVFKALILASGMFCAAAACQFPEYYQQYMQRLSGAIDEISSIVEMFDADATGMNLTREDALDELSAGGGMAAARALSMRRVFDRHDKLTNDLSALQVNSKVEQAIQAWRMTDVDVAKKAWQDFRPAIPATLEGVGFGAAGFLAGMLAMSALLALLRFFMIGHRKEPA